MSPFARVHTAPESPLRVVVVGAGGMGRAWLRTIKASDCAELAGVVDLDVPATAAALAELGLPDLPTGTDAVALAAETNAQAVINVTVPIAHHPVTTAALFAGLPVLGEKPVADDLARALSLAAAAEISGQLFMVSQSRRWNPQLAAMRDATGDLGRIGTVTTQFFRAPHFGGFREDMAHVLLLDMAIHPFDSVRYLLGDEPVAVNCQEYNPAWSWYAGAAAATAVFEMASGARYSYDGSWCAPGAETSWNGVWRVSGEHGSALWDGDSEPVVDTTAERSVHSRSPHDGIAGSLQVFTEALASGTTPSGEVHENVMSLAMVEAAVESAETRQRVLLDDVLTRAWEKAINEETHAEVRDVLSNWPSVREALNPTRESSRATVVS